MRQVNALVNRFPQHELAIHRLYLRDTTFRTICVDYEDANTALRHWQQRPNVSARAVRQYRQILQELEAELLGLIETSLAVCLERQAAAAARRRAVAYRPTATGASGWKRTM